MVLWKDTAISCSYLADSLEIPHWQRQSSSAATFKLNQLNQLNREYKTWKAFLIHQTQRVFLVSKQISLPPNKHLLFLWQTNSCAFISPSQPHWRLQENIWELGKKWEKFSEEDRTLGFTAVLSLPLSQVSALLRAFVTPGSPDKCSCYNGIFLGNCS